MSAVQDLERGDVLVPLVGDEALKAMPVEVGEGQLRSRVRALAPADQARRLGPARERDDVGQLGDPGAVAVLTVGVERRAPGVLGQGEDRAAS